MKDYLLIYRADFSFMSTRTSEEAQANTKRWMDWIGSIAAQNKLTDRGNRLDPSGKVLKADNMVTNGPYAEIKETIGGYSIIKADSYEAAIELAKGCPVLTVGGNVEVREISIM
jgi:hypothetical protein